MESKTSMEYVVCNLCGSEEYSIMYEPTITDYDPTKVFSASGGIMGTQQIVKCKHCCLVYVNPRIKTTIVSDSYSDAVDESYVSQSEVRQKTFSKGLKLVERVLPKKGKILDVGCAAGFFLQVAKLNGWETYGVEPSRWMSKWGNEKFGVNIINGVLRDANFPSEFYDAVTMWDVLEHTPDPLGELRETYRVLKKNGILIINIPNVGSKLARLAGRRWWFYLSVHLYHFSPETISTMLEKAGFEVVSVKRHYQTLTLGHLIIMVGLYNKKLSNLAFKISESIGISHLEIPYYASQANIIARRK